MNDFDWIAAIKSSFNNTPVLLDQFQLTEEYEQQFLYNPPVYQQFSPTAPPITVVKKTRIIMSYLIDDASLLRGNLAGSIGHAVIDLLPKSVSRRISAYDNSREIFRNALRVTFQVIISDLEEFKKELYEETWGQYSKEFDQNLEGILAKKVE